MMIYLAILLLFGLLMWDPARWLWRDYLEWERGRTPLEDPHGPFDGHPTGVPGGAAVAADADRSRP